MGKIKQLPKNLINLIAAGEVIERPASVLKELLENSIDAGSSEIIVKVEDYGKKLIEVSDNGSGMTSEDAQIAFNKHATSKLSSEEDLEKILTLGFRGEALATISAIAESVELDTYSPEDKPAKIIVENGEQKEATSTRTSQGTRIRVENIFKNIPARKKFLKSDNVELKYITNTFLEVALINIHIHFELYHNNNLLYRLTKTENIIERIYEIWGDKVAKSLLPSQKFQGSTHNIEAFIVKPEFARKNNYLQNVYINNRFIGSKTISAAVQQGYHGFIHKELKPYYFILIHMDPTQIDVNVHPRKLEVRLENPDQIFRDTYKLVKNILEKETRTLVTENLTSVSNEESALTHNGSTEFKTPSSKLQIPNNSVSLRGGTTKQSLSNYPSSKDSNLIVRDTLSFTQYLIDDQTEVIEEEDYLTFDFSPTQLFNTYIVYEKGHEVIFVDQHAAAEKILFEKLAFQVGEVKTKPLLIPEVKELKKGDKAILLAKQDELRQIGIIIEDFGGNTINITEIPEVLDRVDIDHYISELIDPSDDYTWTNIDFRELKIPKEIYALIAITACHGSIRAGQKLNTDEMKQILRDLAKLKYPASCPHGRPTTWNLTRSEVEKGFRRII